MSDRGFVGLQLQFDPQRPQHLDAKLQASNGLRLEHEVLQTCMMQWEQVQIPLNPLGSQSNQALHVLQLASEARQLGTVGVEG